MTEQELDALQAKWQQVVTDTEREESGMNYCYEEWMEAPEDIAELIAEVRRLREQLDNERQMAYEMEAGDDL